MGMEFVQRKDKDDWVTPPEIIDPLNEYIGIDLDPCAHPKTRHGEKNYYLCSTDGIDLPWYQNGLKLPWFGDVFVNPPFSQKLEWIRKAVNEYFNNDDVDRVFILTPDSTDVISWYHEYIAKYCQFSWFPEGRINYIEPNNYKQIKGVSFGSMLSILAEDIPQRLKEYFDANGDLVIRYNLL